MTIFLRSSKPPGCDLCGEVAELRPYGPKGKWICFPCGMKNKKTTEAAFQRRLDADVSSDSSKGGK